MPRSAAWPICLSVWHLIPAEVIKGLDAAHFEILDALCADNETDNIDAQIDSLCADPAFGAELRALAGADDSLESQFRSRLVRCCSATSRQDFVTDLRCFVDWCFDNKKIAFGQSRPLCAAMGYCVLLGNYFLERESIIHDFFIRGRGLWHVFNRQASLSDHEQWMKNHLYSMVTHAQCLHQLLAYKARGEHAERFHRVQQTITPSTPIDTIIFAELYSHQSRKAYVPRSDFAHARSMPWALYQSFVRCCSQSVLAKTVKKVPSAATLALGGQDTSDSGKSADCLTPSGAGAGYVPKDAQTATSPPRPKRRGAIAAAALASRK